MTEPPIRCVCFDWGGVILRICRSFAEGVEAAGLDQRAGPDHPSSADHPELYTVRKGISADYQVGKIDDTAFCDAISRSMNGLYSPAEIALIHDAWLLGEYDGAAELVAELHDAGRAATAMLSNTNERHWARRERDFPTASTLHHQHASHLLGLVKPDPAIYHAFARETGLAPREILFFDDLEANITAARDAGWQAEHIDHTGDTASQMRQHLTNRGLL